jgi:uncharacterized protein
MKKKELLIESLRQVFEPEKPLVKMLRTPSGCYLYDTGTNKILGCRKEVYDLLDNFLAKNVNEAAADFINRYSETEFITAAQEIVDAIKAENILQVKKATQFGLSDHFKNVEEILSTKVQSINLEVTQDCNLRCLYCIYNDYYEGKRNHTAIQMPFDIAERAIDFLKKNSSQSELKSIGFYGGEPLKRIQFIKRCVNYAKEVFPNQKLRFNITTNGTMINPKIAEYLLHEGFSIMVSIDGPEPIHNRYRKDKVGNGSFDKTLLGLKNLCEKYKLIQRGTITLNVVYAPPFSVKKLDVIYKFFKELTWLPETINIVTYYPTEGTVPGYLVMEEGLKEDKNATDWAFDKYKESFEKSGTMVKSIIEHKLATIIQRPVFKKPFDSYYLNGCCIPGQRKTYIAANGSIHICEKISTFAPPVGDIEKGFDIATIKELYIDEYARKSIYDCAACWALRLCDICYVSAMDDEGNLSMEKKRQYCKSKRGYLEAILGKFSTCMEENPGKLDYLYNYEIV